MKAIWDGERSVVVTERYKAALLELIRAEIEMMRASFPESAEYWTWGIATVGDMEKCNGVSMTFGGDYDKPEGIEGNARVIFE